MNDFKGTLIIMLQDLSISIRCYIIMGMHQQKWNYYPFWEEVVSRLESTLPEHECVTWIHRISYIESKDRAIVLAVPSLFIRDHVKVNYLSNISELLNEIIGENISVEIDVRQQSELKQASQTKPSEPQSEMRIASPMPKAQSKPKDRNINSAYQFGSFVVGENSAFSYNVSMAIAKNPGVSYNPCLIYGGVGLGKTHLIQSIGNYIQDNTPELQVVYVTAEKFTNEFIQSISEKKTPQFRNKYRKADVLLIDDIHFLQRKESTQEELFHVFNNLFESNKQLVFTCDRPINELQDITDRLKNRFTRGINVDLQPPDFETRLAILRKKCDNQGAHISSEILEYISKNIFTNVRDLESSLTKLIAYSTLLNKEITLDIAKEQLRSTYSAKKDQAKDLDSIIRVVADYFNISPYEIKGKKRTKSVVLPRQIAMYIARHITEFSTTEIGYEFGGRDHTTVMHSVQKVELLIQNDVALSNSIQNLIRQIHDYKRE